MGDRPYFGAPLVLAVSEVSFTVILVRSDVSGKSGVSEYGTLATPTLVYLTADWLQ